ncbi:class I SAM-dependent methyltransferase [Paenibacillus macquariensis]|uniref:Methyltransferase domain-containing protein n=1 Tax=Paenibacillus macquariensis TaxID=948756 RepID=A0ABY1JMR3_9BACL|nr:class I SAM-dependent methyltransferase [Paenibacillus macquariensis]MEC0092293.1 class I SAM-dependent methyltransferase [Paenibacillus macquariensis]OAB37164.1 methyltransferase [Paenibacillus macquariensis subsp. macquariensis]SIQ46848.1 Methyltransferase domain-containing protein [Paenibacillus macquariensis]
MDRVAHIRTEEKKYHDHCFEHYTLFEPGSWLHKPVKTVMDLLEHFNDRRDLKVLDLGCGIGRNSIPMAEAFKNRNGRIICVDLLESAIEKLNNYSKEYGVQQCIETILSDIESFDIKEAEYDAIIAVSALEHVSSEEALTRKLHEMTLGTRLNGINCIIINTNVREVVIDSNLALDPMFEVNLSTDRLLAILDQQYEGWEIMIRIVKPLIFEIDRNSIPVNLSADCITFEARRICES